MKLVLIFAAMMCLYSAFELPYPLNEAYSGVQFASFVKTYNKFGQYKTNEEFLERYAIFKQTLKSIDELNAEDNGAVFAVNKFSDLTPEEFKSTYLGYKGRKTEENFLEFKLALAKEVTTDLNDVPVSKDWRKLGAVTAVKDQGQCGSCWTFGAVAALEGQYVLEAKQPLTSFSEEELVNCVKKDDACNGGLQEDAFDWLKTHGEELESAYPYTSGGGRDGSCKYKASKGKLEVTSWKKLPKGDEVTLKSTVAAEGPITVAVNAGPFQSYSSGVLHPKRCNKNDLDHAVTVVGYGVAGTKPYWIIKNSWAEDWGEEGYIRLYRGKNVCGVAQEALSVSIKTL